jgi:hypothetical protein
MISGLDREKVFCCPWEDYVVLALDEFSWVVREHEPPSSLILVFPLALVKDVDGASVKRTAGSGKYLNTI